MRRILSVILVIASWSTAPAQKSPSKFGEIPMDDMNMTIYGKDSSAVAVYLIDYGKAYIEVQIDNPMLSFEHHVRIKILKQEGLSWADAQISLLNISGRDEYVSNFKAVTYNLENGKVVETKLSKDGIFKEKVDRFRMRQKFTFPNAKVGSVLEYTYTTKSEFFTRFPNWAFQNDIPVRISEYWAIFPDGFRYEKYMQGYVGGTGYEVKHQNTAGINATAHHWVFRDVPSFKAEPYMTSKDDYVSRVNFALASVTSSSGVTQDIMGSWESLVKQLSEDEDFGKVIAKSGFLKSKVESLTAGMTDPMQKITAIHDFVKQNIEYDGVEDFYAGNLKDVMEKKKGSSGDINLLLASMLDKAGFEVEMILLSTRDHGFIRQQFPMSRQFNYVICMVKVGDKTLLLDATEKYLPLTVLPERCLNGQGLIVAKTFKGWMDVTSKTKARTVVKAELNMDAAAELKGTVVIERDGYDALEMRNKYFLKGEESYNKDFIASRSWAVQKTDFEGVADLSKAAKETREVIIPEHASVAGDVIYISPLITSQLAENPFKDEKRTFPVDFGRPTERLYMIKITLPEGYVVDEAPAPKAFAMPGNAARYTYNVIQTGNTINVISNFQINKSMYSQAEYPVLREFYNQVVAKQAEQIVLKKKS